MTVREDALLRRCFRELDRLLCSEDQPRDDHGRFGSGGSSEQPGHLAASDGQSIADQADKDVSAMNDSLAAVDDAKSSLEMVIGTAEDVASEEDDAIENGTESDEYNEWEASNTAAMADVAQMASEYRAALAAHVEQANAALAKLDKTMATFAKEYS